MHLQIPFHGSPFTLDSAGVAGFFGGDETLSAMGTVHLYRGRRWLGWYNSPGSYTVAKRYGQLANSRFWDGLFPGPNSEPAEMFGLDGKAGPRYVASLSGTDMTTGHLGYLTIQMSKEVEDMAVQGKASTETLPASVTVIRVGDVMDMDEVGMMSTHHALLATIPITISIMTCFSCAVFADWYAFSLILLGIVSSGITCFVIGTARLHLRGPKTVTPGVPPGDGLLLTPRDVVVLIGSEKDVNVITKGHFLLNMHGGREYRSVGLCSLLLLAQFLLQLLLIPQATLFGQMMFLASCAASWVYNSFLSSLESEKIQGDLLLKALQVEGRAIQKYCLHNRRSQAVFACSILSDGNETNEDFDAERMLSLFVPNKTRVWNLWRKKVAAQLKSTCRDKKFHVTAEEKEGLCEEHCRLLKTFLDDAELAFKAYYERVRYPRSIDNWEEKIVYVYDDANYEQTLELIENTSPYALTGSIFAAERKAFLTATNKLRNVAGNVYCNEKCTGAVVGQQPFGELEERASGTNDKAGSISIFYRFVSARSIKENFVGLEDFQ